MPKSKKQTFDDAMAALLTLAAAGNMVMYKSYNGVLQWLEAQANQETAKERIGGMISLGSDSGQSVSLAVHRNATLALLLVMATRYAASSKEISARKSAASGFRTVQDTHAVVKELIERSARIVESHGGILIQPKVYGHATRLRTPNVALMLRSGRDTAKQLLGEAYGYTTRSRSGFRSKYESWFGTAPPDSVQENLKRMYDALCRKSVNFDADGRGAQGGLQSGWANATPQTYTDFLKKDYVDINLAEHFFDSGKTGEHSSQIVEDPAIVSDVLNRHMELAREKEAVGTSFFADIKLGADIDLRQARHDRELADVQRRIDANAAGFPSSRDDKISVAGVIVHETSHNVVSTQDVQINSVTMYGPNLCGWLARTHPDKAVNNADSYRLYCEEFMVR